SGAGGIRHLPPFPTRRSSDLVELVARGGAPPGLLGEGGGEAAGAGGRVPAVGARGPVGEPLGRGQVGAGQLGGGGQLVDLARGEDRKSTRLNSSHVEISYAVF